jgi:hypothetical protein
MHQGFEWLVGQFQGNRFVGRLEIGAWSKQPALFLRSASAEGWDFPRYVTHHRTVGWVQPQLEGNERPMPHLVETTSRCGTPAPRSLDAKLFVLPKSSADKTPIEPFFAKLEDYLPETS